MVPIVPHVALDPVAVRDSMQYLITTYGVSEAEALRRLELQNDAQQLEGMLQKELPDEYGGMWLDQDNGGVLVVAVTRPDSIRPYVGGMLDGGHVTSRKVAFSLRDLAAARDRLAKKLKEGPDATYLPAVDIPQNRVVLWQREWVKQEKLAGTWEATSLSKRPTMAVAMRSSQVSAEDDAAHEAVAAELPDMVAQAVFPRPAQSYTPFVDWGVCHPLYCPWWYGPMAGGMRLDIQRDDGSRGGCTVGYNVRSSGRLWNGWAWILTAGHCAISKTNQAYTQHDGWNVFMQHGVERNAYPYDYAVVAYVDGTQSVQWLEQFSGRNRVLKYCRNGGHDSDSGTPCGAQATSASEYITGYYPLSSIRAGWVVCASGAGSDPANYPDSYPSGAGAGYLVGTRCGKVLSTDVGINTDICARAGDSGGPLFSQIDHTAYGILEGNQQHRSGACQSGERNNYSPISLILDDINWGSQSLMANYDTSMTIIMSPNG